MSDPLFLAEEEGSSEESQLASTFSRGRAAPALHLVYESKILNKLLNLTRGTAGLFFCG
jgi:hypothetical protein